MPVNPLFGPLIKMGQKPFIMTFRRSDVATDADLLKLAPGENILMIGYPIGIWDKVNNAPVFRKGIAATYPGKHYDGKPEFMIDAASFPGSRGSPVLVHDLIYYDREKHAIAWDTSGSRTKLLGILHSVVQYTAEGEIKIVPVPTTTTTAPAPAPTTTAPTATAPVPAVNKPIVLTPLMANLGLVVRAEKLFDFEPRSYGLCTRTHRASRIESTCFAIDGTKGVTFERPGDCLEPPGVQTPTNSHQFVGREFREFRHPPIRQSEKRVQASTNSSVVSSYIHRFVGREFGHPPTRE